MSIVHAQSDFIRVGFCRPSTSTLAVGSFTPPLTVEEMQQGALVPLNSDDVEGGKINIGKAFKKRGKVLKPVGRAVAKEGKAFANDVLKPAGEDVLSSLNSKATKGVSNAANAISDKIDSIGQQPPMAVAAEAAEFQKKRVASAAMKKRNEVVKAVMKKHNMSKPEASKFVKQHDLYK